ncbi:Transmembrane E3 ubiquitin-protein ligase 1 [Escovopsis weberi]|uniref:DSC E3 ubiquitin ligase complex subunit A n=1 Tax=Escovopsis weberi TaxID=150374 RepID=A0A0M9VTU0_ESCWE|nr:Transmembrane E3 ubiquitin-protein ligase 1 [Escovopsis weberi]
MPQTQRPAVAILAILLLVWLIFPEGDYQSQSLAFSDLVSQRLARYRYALRQLDQSRWGDFSPLSSGPPSAESQAGAVGDRPAQPKYLNLTGFRAEDGLAWEDLDRFRDKGLQLSRHAVPPVGGRWLWETARGEPLWADADGTLFGQWVRRAGQSNRTFNSYNLSDSVPSMEWVGLRQGWARNLTGDAGRILLRLEGNKTVSQYEQLPANQRPLSGGMIRNVRGAVTIEDTHGSGLSWETRLWGVHWPRQGVILMTTTSEKFEGIFGLPHLAPGPDFFQSSQWLLNQTLSRVLSEKERDVYADQTMPWNSDIENPHYTANPSPHCEYVLYAQIHPPNLQQDLEPLSDGETPSEAIRVIESELEHPLGAPIHAVPELQISTVIYSPDCSFFLESKGPPQFPSYEGTHLVGMKKQVHLHQIKTWILAYGAVMFYQVYLLKNQIKETYTPSTLGRVSFETTSIMVIADGLTFTAAATWVSSAAATFLPTLALMFASFLSMAIGGNLLARIHEVQQPAQARRQADQLGINNNNNNNNRNGNIDNSSSSSSDPSVPGIAPILPAPVTAGHRPLASLAAGPPTPAATITDDAPIALPDPRRSPAASAAAQTLTFQSIIGRFILCSLCIAFLAVVSTSWYASLRALFFNLCAAAYLSLWMPQVYRNTMRNCRRALGWQFVAGQSAARLLPVAYFWVKPDNFLYARTDPRAFAALAAWVWLQILLLALQDALGPRFGVPAAWTPDAWDYHPVLRQDSVEAGGLPIGLAAAAAADDAPDRRRNSSSSDDKAPRPDHGLRAIDCAICREILEVPVVRAGEDDVSVASVFARRMYMVTPCRHIFHTACLEGWMRFRLQCPICREELPPL